MLLPSVGISYEYTPYISPSYRNSACKPPVYKHAKTPTQKWLRR